MTPCDGNPQSVTSIKPLLAVMAVSALVAIGTAFVLPVSILDGAVLKTFSSSIASIIPSVSIMSSGAVDPVRANVTWAVQWAFFPVHLFFWMTVARPWGTKDKPIVLHMRPDMSFGSLRFGAIVGIIFCSALISSDIGLSNFPGFLRGTMFEGDPLHLPILLRAPFTSNMGMAFYAWIVPFANSMCYWMLLGFAINFRLFFKQ